MSIDPKELRIGSIVFSAFDKNDQPEPCEVRQLKNLGIVWRSIGSSDSEGGNYTSYENVSPIPITTELLEKCVLLKNGEFPDIEYFSVMNGSLYFEGNYTAVDIKYLHQLQNLYFSLTGNELTINL